MRKERVLLVDDDGIALLVHSKMLEQHAEIVTAANANEALEIIKKDKAFAVIISDQYMPDMNGAELLQIVGVMVPNMVRIMITGFADLDVAMQAVNLGNVFRFLVKPCCQEDLVLALAAGLDKYRQSAGEISQEAALTEPLTEREREVLRLLGIGFTSGEIALAMGITIGTVKTHVHHIFGKLAVNNRIKAVAKAKNMGLISR
ncbi:MULTISPECIES: response regulator transcription factor [Pelosinus]|uniref:Regulatory protein LuxR n=1 Tax=Pelosinus fermentans B4 TaxID=1149862 RepID=I9ASB7_9FIRM|nr:MULTISPECIES: DNA-binding response regulator [Pelosinus]EIW15832.1 regulatory protein LuxR [Pelosinus fermentans B4]EIW27462.1 two component transcriptional regulator, LuxR family [Pelosinus fermentans A11]OAM92581.1 two component transcriptional regulator, LuxR family [Pelosinus fermentans DSM 17108]SDQ49758.1 DNA-binding response regulator, NarL/FixJ family, contains REC and HTH domains [Pelosinus fermentans]